MSLPVDLNARLPPGTASPEPTSLRTLQDALSNEHDQRRRAECMAEIQRDAVQLALDLLGRELDVAGFFRAFMKRLVDDSESHACGVWLLDETSSECSLWMAIVEGELYNKDHAGWETLALPSASMAEHLKSYRSGWTETIEYHGQDARLPDAVRAYHEGAGVNSLIVAPLALPTRNLGWVGLATANTDECEQVWRRALVDAMAGQATLALHHSRLAEQSRLEGRRQAVLEERNRIARDIHDTLAQGFAAILMQLQAAQRAGAGSVPAAVAGSLDTAVELARTHMIEARRSVSALRPTSPDQEDVAAALERMTGLARRTSGVPIESLYRSPAAVRRRRRTRDYRHRAGSPDQCRPPRARPAD